jgi:chromosomal replication initiation ATPase DnaA
MTDQQIEWGMSRRCRQIVVDVASLHEMNPRTLLAPLRHRRVAWARQEAMARIRALRTDEGKHVFSLPAIGRMFGMDHTTVLHGLRAIEKRNGITSPVYPVTYDGEDTRL